MSEIFNKDVFYQNIKHLMICLDISSDKAFNERLKKRDYLSRIKRGELVPPLETREEIASILKTTVVWLKTKHEIKSSDSGSISDTNGLFGRTEHYQTNRNCYGDLGVVARINGVKIDLAPVVIAFPVPPSDNAAGSTFSVTQFEPEAGTEPKALAPNDRSNLVAMAHNVLHSQTDYAVSLAANIRSFHRAIESERRLSDYDKRLTKIEKQSPNVGSEKEKAM